MRLVIIFLLLTGFLCGCAQSGFPFSGKPGEPGERPFQPPEFSQEEAVRLAKEHLSAELGISTDEIAVVLVEEVNWPDTSLGLPEPGKFYAQVVVPGFKITLRALGQDYLYHAGWMKNQMLVIPATKRQS